MLVKDLEVILKVAKFRSITAAATELDMQAATASAAVKRVEASLGFELFTRTTRQLRLSPAGERYLPQCEQAVLLLNHAKKELQNNQGVNEEIRIALSSDLGRNIVMPWIEEFLQNHPQISLRTSVSDSHIDFYRDSIDIALRYGSPTEEKLYGFKICDVPRVLCASPNYLKGKKAIKHPEDLKSHNGLFYQLQDILQDEWLFTKENTLYKVKLIGNRASDDGDLVRRWCVSGLGVAIKSSLDMSQELLSGSVVNLMTDYHPKSTELWLVCPSRQSITPTIRLLKDHLKARAENVMNQLVQQGILEKAVLNKK